MNNLKKFIYSFFKKTYVFDTYLVQIEGSLNPLIPLDRFTVESTSIKDAKEALFDFVRNKYKKEKIAYIQIKEKKSLKTRR